MKILFGVQGTGNGHTSRAREMARAFRERGVGVEVDFLFSGRPADQYFDMEVFGDYQVRRGFTFITENGHINHVKTALSNNLFAVAREVQQLDLSGYDLVLNDFEPVSAWAAKRQKVPSVGVSHQCSFLHQVPIQGQNVLDKGIIHYFAPTQQQLGLHWYHFEQPILPPIIPAMAMDKVSDNGRVLVYLPFESPDEVITLLSHFSEQTFDFYHPLHTEFEEKQNVHCHPLSRDGFHRALLSCSGVIANGGFELPSEAIGIGKKLLLKPLQGQFEQESNVMTLEMMGLAKVMNTLNLNALRTWLDQPSVGAVRFPNVANHIVDWVLKGDWDDYSLLWDNLWSAVEYPEAVEDLVSEFDTPKTRLKKRASLTSL
ncbi:MJ1255/VC2487 family glycosyltransferase [Thaumasiovibrio subtropicus]|uniref:MJ1255/VC2487 family glycosyltransferase n=1 Tax=Thaumasiovibrio subtropicus TaxID=1891207 RepID=UPI000B354193|nr:MJ1255/VC2487 family glycosyltransferase [Thaumasiovibrio subtropicus]